MNGKTKLITYALGGLVLVGLAFLFLIQPTLRKVSSLSQVELEARTEAIRLDQQILAYRTAQSDLSKAVNKNLLFSSLVDDKNLYVPIEEMEAAVKNTNSTHQLKILRESLDPKDTVASSQKKVLDQPGLEEVPYTLTAQNTDYPSLVNLFSFLENLPHFTEVSHIDLSYQSVEGSTEEQLTAVLNGVFLAKPFAE